MPVTNHSLQGRALDSASTSGNSTKASVCDAMAAPGTGYETDDSEGIVGGK